MGREMTYDELMALYQQAQNTPGGIVDPDAQAFMLPNGQVAAWNGSGFTLASGDARSGGIQRYGVTPEGTSDMGFEPLDADAKFRRNLLTQLALGAGVVGAGALAGGAIGGGAAAAAPAAPAASSSFGAGLGGFGAGLDSMPTFLGTGSGALGPGGAAIVGGGGIDAGSILGGASGWATGAAPAFGAAPVLGSAMGGSANTPTDWSKLITGGAGSLLSNPGLIAAGLGAAAGIAGNGDIKSSANTVADTSNVGNTATSGTTQQGLAPWLEQYARQGLSAGAGLLSQGTTNPMIQQAGGLLSNMATQGNPVVNAAMQQQQDVIGGKYLGPNPFLDQYARGVSDRMGEGYATGTRAGVFSGYNNDGNSVQAKSGFGQALGNADRSFADSLGQTMSGLYMQNYQNERASQNAAAQSAPNLANFGLNAATTLGNFGSQQQLLPWQQVQAFQGLVNPAFGSSATSNQTGTTNQIGRTNQTQTQNIAGPNAALAGVGGAMAGYGMYRNLFPRG